VASARQKAGALYWLQPPALGWRCTAKAARAREVGENRPCFDRASEACATDSDPVKQAQIQAIPSDLGYKSQEADSLQRASRMELESLRIQLKKSEAYFAQAEILGFLEKNRRKFTPKNVAFAMAG
jgi:hypothetical protein